MSGEVRKIGHYCRVRSADGQLRDIRGLKVGGLAVWPGQLILVPAEEINDPQIKLKLERVGPLVLAPGGFPVRGGYALLLFQSQGHGP